MHGNKKYTQKLENVLLFDIKKYNKHQECVGECRKNVRKAVNMNVEIFYVVSVRMQGYIILEDQKFRRYRPDRNQVHFLFVFSRKNMVKTISVQVTLIFMDSKSIDNIDSAVEIKIRLVA